jgi:hypothetical protein
MERNFVNGIIEYHYCYLMREVFEILNEFTDPYYPNICRHLLIWAQAYKTFGRLSRRLAKSSQWN